MATASGCIVWLTGLPRAGKSTLAERVRDRLRERGVTSAILDGDAVREALVPPPGYDPEGREHFYATLANLAALLARQGLAVLVPATAHRRAFRDRARALAPRFVEVHVDSDAAACAAHDARGLYDSAARAQLPGVGVPYEPPLTPDVVAHGGHDDAAARAIVAAVLAG
jgi:adenylylsulfate kinase